MPFLYSTQVLNMACENVSRVLLSRTACCHNLVSYMTSPLSGAERRSSRRFNMRLPLVIRAESPSGPREIRTESRDVSSRGVFFSFPGELEPGASLELVMTLPDEITLAGPVRVRCVGHVVRVDTSRGETGVAVKIDRYEFLRSPSP
jgi:hypothetical protein